jgi:uncharacterized protein
MKYVRNGGRNVRVVLDTNIVVSALLFGGRPSQIVLAADSGIVELSTSLELLTELSTTLQKSKFRKIFAASARMPIELVFQYQASCLIASVNNVIPVVTADPDDDVVLATAVAASADAIVTGNQHLLSLGQYQRIEIITAAQLLQKLGLP